jgi:hypothetical protein
MNWAALVVAVTVSTGLSFAVFNFLVATFVPEFDGLPWK